jgi:hypothetical protein
MVVAVYNPTGGKYVAVLCQGMVDTVVEDGEVQFF